jgi:hypothetical protein
VAETFLTPGDFPIWIAQAQFIHSWYAAWSGENILLQWSFSRRGALATVQTHNTLPDSSISFEELYLLVQEPVQSTQAITHGKNGSITKLKNGTFL